MTKYSLKNIFLGIGIGLIIASLANISAAPDRLTKDEVIREAEQYDLIVMEAKDMIKKDAEEDTNKQNAQTTEAPAQSVTIIIESGATSESISEILLNNKLIKSKQDFVIRLRELNKESRVQIGSFEIPIGASVDKIIEIITKSPK